MSPFHVGNGMQVVALPNYDPDDAKRRDELFKEIEKLQREYMARLKPFHDQLADIERRHIPRLHLTG